MLRVLVLSVVASVAHCHSCIVCSYTRNGNLFDGGSDPVCQAAQERHLLKYAQECASTALNVPQTKCVAEITVMTWGFIGISRRCASNCSLYENRMARGYGQEIEVIPMCCETNNCNTWNSSKISGGADRRETCYAVVLVCLLVYFPVWTPQPV